jgi:hypothetical protein
MAAAAHTENPAEIPPPDPRFSAVFSAVVRAWHSCMLGIWSMPITDIERHRWLGRRLRLTACIAMVGRQ